MGHFIDTPLIAGDFIRSGISLQNWAHRNGLKEAMLLESFIGARKNDNWDDFVAVFIKSKKYTSYYKKRMISFLSDYSNAHLLGSEKIYNFKDKSFDQLIISKKEQEINEILNSTCWKITSPLRFLGRIKNKLLNN